MEQLNEYIKTFLSTKIDEVVETNPMLSTMSARIKRGVNAIVDDKLSMTSNNGVFLKAFMHDENGKFDVSIYDEVQSMLNEMPIQKYNVINGLMDASVGKGKIEIAFAQNPITTFLLPNSGKITIGSSDIKELFDLIATKQS